jgi:single-stranded DNA-specific DHH superfamily exonuclease
MMPLCRLLVDVLKHRGIADPDLFVAPSVWSDMPSPFLIEGMEQAVVHVLAAVQSKQRLAVFGDYDVDGVLSTAILQATLRKLGVQPVVYVRKQKTDKRDACHILKLLVEDRFPCIWVPDARMRDQRQMLSIVTSWCRYVRG